MSALSTSDLMVTPEGCHWVRLPCLRWCWDLSSQPQAVMARLGRAPKETQTLLVSEGHHAQTEAGSSRRARLWETLGVLSLQEVQRHR